MRRALAQARRASGRTFPNPPVGAVVYRGDRVLGVGWTRPPGGPHAEVVALDAVARRHGERALRGASLAVTLEPCDHTGRTGPCTRRILDAGIARVAAGHLDPHPEVHGRGLRRLRRAGIEVQSGVLEAECRAQHRGFLSRVERGRPFVSLKLAASLDGRIATAGGESRWISSPASRAVVQRLRARTDAVLVGSRTALADDPELWARIGGRVRHRPVRLVMDSQLRLPPDARMLQGEDPHTWVLCSPSAPAARRRALEQRGAVVLPVVPGAAGGRGGGAAGRKEKSRRSGRRRHGPEPGLDLRAALAALAERGLTEILVEGGGELAAALLREDLVDEVHWFAAPRLLGGDGRPALGPLALRSLSDAPPLADVRVRRVGPDVHWTGRVARRGKGGG